MDDMLATMDGPRRYAAEWDGLRLIIEPEPDHVQAFVYDPEECDVLYTAARISIDAAKIAAIDFVASSRFGPRHGLDPRVIAEMLIWEPES